MRNLKELNKEVKELKGKENITFVAGATISDMLAAEPQTCKKIDFVETRNKLTRKGLIYCLAAEPGRETIEEAIAGFLAEEARKARQAEFVREVCRLNIVKAEIKNIERITKDPRVVRIQNILKNIENTDDKEYIVDILVDGLTGFTYSEKAYIKENLI